MPGTGRPLFVGQYPLRITVSRDGSRWCACATLTTRDGPWSVCAYADEDVIARALMQLAAANAAAAGGAFDFGSLFRDIGTTARSLAQSVATRDAGRIVSDVVRSPILSTAVSFIPGVGPVASSALGAASTLIDRIEGGDRYAAANLGRIATAARAGDKTAGDAMKTTAAVFASRPEARMVGTPGAPSSPDPTMRTVGTVVETLGGLLSAFAPLAGGGRASGGGQVWASGGPLRVHIEHERNARSAAAAGAWEGLRWAFDEYVRPNRPIRAEVFDSRDGYRGGLAAMSARRSSAPRMVSAGTVPLLGEG